MGGRGGKGKEKRVLSTPIWISFAPLPMVRKLSSLRKATEPAVGRSSVTIFSKLEGAKKKNYTCQVFQ